MLSKAPSRRNSEFSRPWPCCAQGHKGAKSRFRGFVSKRELNSLSQPLPGAAPDFPALPAQDRLSSEAGLKEQRLGHEVDLSSRPGCIWRGGRVSGKHTLLQALACSPVSRGRVWRGEDRDRIGEDLQVENLGWGGGRAGEEQA